MRVLDQQVFRGERALFHARDLSIHHGLFEDGESPLKESRDIELYNTMFKWKYPLWYAHHIRLYDCSLFEMARAGIWYTDDIEMKNTVIEAPKAFRRCDGVRLDRVQFSNAEETLWNCKNVELKDVFARGNYFAMGSENIDIDGFELVGNYSFDGCKNVHVKNAKLISKDAFWNCENVVVEDCFISGEYLGWNSKHLVFKRCIIESLQGLCYIEDLVMEDCKLIHTTLAFEFVDRVDASISSRIDSVKNPISGKITAHDIGEVILDADVIDPAKTTITKLAPASK